MIEVCHSADPTCAEIAALAAMVLRCEAVEDPAEGDDRSVRVLFRGRQVASVYVGTADHPPAWVAAMAARLGRCLDDTGFGGQEGLRDLHRSHSVVRRAERERAAKAASRAEDRRGRGERLELGTEAVQTTADDRGGE